VKIGLSLDTIMGEGVPKKVAEEQIRIQSNRMEKNSQMRDKFVIHRICNRTRGLLIILM
jgi:hypothetical protein